jgi:glutamate carboxypeptidase
VLGAEAVEAMTSRFDAAGYFQSTLPESIDLLRRLVEVNSFTANEAGVRRNAEIVEEMFEGFRARREGEHLVLTRPGSRRVVLISHLDTVYAPDDGFAWREEGPRIYGPGVADIKGGTVVMWRALLALRQFAPDAFEGLGWTLLFNASEERGSAGFAELARREAAGAEACLAYEPGYPANTLVVARKGSARFTLRVRGRSAHSGSRHEEGANAIVELAGKILKIAALTDYARGITTNVGVARGGTVVNAVPESAEALIDLRAKDPDSFEAGKREIRAICREAEVRSASDGFPCALELEDHHDYTPMVRNAGTDALFELARGVDPTVEPQERGGSGDVCHVWREAPTLDGLGPVGDDCHCTGREYVLRDTLASRALLSYGLFRDVFLSVRNSSSLSRF